MNFNFFDLFWVFLVLSSFVPIFQRMRIANARNSLIRQFEKKRDSRLITLIHRQEALSFLGLGVQPPTPTWGSMISLNRAYINSAPWMVIFPGLAISITVISFNILGDFLRDKLDPRMQV